jgi:hypothetical protein
MSDPQETGELTERFRAFAQSGDPEPRNTARVALILGGAVVAIVAIVVIALLVA